MVWWHFPTAGGVNLAAEGVSRKAAQHFRKACRAGAHKTHSAGFARGHLQANLVVLPKREAFAFLNFALLNPKPCPLLEVSAPGDPLLPRLCVEGHEADVRTDLPAYRVWKDGVIVEETSDVSSVYDERNEEDEFLAFALGCSFSWEDELAEAGLASPHNEAGLNVPMYNTCHRLQPFGPFKGNLVVSMRSFASKADAERAAKITAHHPHAHGAPVFMGREWREGLGINDLHAPDYGDAPTHDVGDWPVFWACGVTPQNAVKEAKVPFAITHEPGHMLVFDALAEELREV